MIRVLHVIDHLGLGGAQSTLMDMVVNGDTASVEAEVAVMHGRGMFADALEARGVKVHSLASGKWPPSYIPNLVRLLRSGRHDVLHFHLQGSNWLAKPLSAAVSRARRVAHDHSSADLRFRKWWSLLPDGLAHAFSHHVIAVSRGVADFLAEREFVPRRKISVVANGVDTALFVPATGQVRAGARAALGIQPDQFVAGALGRLAPEKNFRLLARLARTMPDVLFVVGGSGQEQRDILEAAGNTENFRLIGEVSDRPLFYAALDAFLLPSLHEALPMTLLEAMSAGIPVVASNLEGVASALGSAGMLVPPGDGNAIVNALRQMAASPLHRRELAAGARERVVNFYDAKKTSADILAIYRKIFATGDFVRG